MKAQQYLCQGERPCSSHHPSGAQGLAPGNAAAAPAVVALRCTQPQTMLNMRGSGQGVQHCCARRHTGHPPLLSPLGTQGRVRAAGLCTPGGGGGGGLS